MASEDAVLLADNENIMRVREGFDHSYFGTGLWAGDDLNAACMEVLKNIERTRWIMLRIANKESVSVRVILRMDILNICCSNSQCGNGVPAKRESPIRVAVGSKR